MSAARVAVTCLGCQEATPYADITQGRCADCHREHERISQRGRVRVRERRTDRYGSESTAWRRLSRQARALQPWCSRCVRAESALAEHERLECDHTPAAWARIAARKPIRLQDVQVLCSTCNKELGSSMPGSERFAEWEAQNVS